MPVQVGRRSGLTAKPMIVWAPLVVPTPPTPAITRPTIRAVELGEIPQIKTTALEDE
jgi:hypothetical protein